MVTASRALWTEALDMARGTLRVGRITDLGLPRPTHEHVRVMWLAGKEAVERLERLEAAARLVVKSAPACPIDCGCALCGLRDLLDPRSADQRERRR